MLLSRVAEGFFREEKMIGWEEVASKWLM